MAKKTLADAVSAFGLSAKSKLSDIAVTGAPEDQLRAPLERLLHDLAEAAGLLTSAIHFVGETRLSEIKTRPDYAVTVKNALVGFIEVKAPGKGADPRQFTGEHDKAQWAKLKSLPNLIYTDGNSFSLWRDGKLLDKIVHLEGDIETSGAKLSAPQSLLALLTDFLNWQPIPPQTAKKLAEVSARLCRLLRDEVIELMVAGNPGLTALATDWRKLLFPEANDEQFADGYAQAITFGLLVARARNISLAGGIDDAAQELRKTSTLIGTALRILTDDVNNQEALKTSLGTLLRVLEAVDWPTISKEKPEAWLYFYEEFLEVYDNTLRKRTGSYYTPPEVVAAMVNLVDETLRGPLFERPMGFASSDVTVADPAVGTGTFLLGVLRKIANTVADDQGQGAVRGAIKAAARRIVGFELQFGPFAVAQLRIVAEMQALLKTPREPIPETPELRLFITDTLGNPFIEEETLGQLYESVAKSRRDANKVKKEERITVVIGNPPYKNSAKGRGGWIEKGSQGREAPMARWAPPVEWGVSQDAKHLKNLYVYFWRWATWKVFGTGWAASTGLIENDKAGIVCFITAAGFLNGDGFQKMREDLRRSSNSIWVIDCSPEGHQPDIPTRIFQGVQQPICIVLAARSLNKSPDASAHVRFIALPQGRREIKFGTLSALRLDGPDWVDCPTGWREPFLPESVGSWARYPAISDIFTFDALGVMPGRTWVIAPDSNSLRERWAVLKREKDIARKRLLFHEHLRGGEPGDKHLGKAISRGLPGHVERLFPVALDQGECIEPTRYAFRSFDQQWIIPDARLINQPSPKLWEMYSARQVHLTALGKVSPTSGPAVTFTGLMPDHDHYKGSFAGRVFPLWRDHDARLSNVSLALLSQLAETFSVSITPEDVMAYVAAVVAHPAFTARFANDLVICRGRDAWARSNMAALLWRALRRS